MTKHNITKQSTTINPTPVSTTSNTLKSQFLRDMELAGMNLASRKRYLHAVEHLIRYYWCSPAELTEKQVSDYLLDQHRQGPAKGTFKLTQFALRLFFKVTLGHDWGLFKKK